MAAARSDGPRGRLITVEGVEGAGKSTQVEGLRVWLAARDVKGSVRSLVLDNDRAIVFVRAVADVPQSHALGDALTAAMREAPGKRVDQVFWKFGGKAP